MTGWALDAGLPLNKLAGGAFGAGLFQKIKDGYTKSPLTSMNRATRFSSSVSVARRLHCALPRRNDRRLRTTNGGFHRRYGGSGISGLPH